MLPRVTQVSAEFSLNTMSSPYLDPNPFFRVGEKVDDNETIRRKKNISTNIKILKLIKH